MARSRRLLGPRVRASCSMSAAAQGQYAAALADLGWTVTGVDVSEDMLAARARAGRVRRPAPTQPSSRSARPCSMQLCRSSRTATLTTSCRRGREVARVLQAGRAVRLRRRPSLLRRAAFPLLAPGCRPPRAHPGWYRSARVTTWTRRASRPEGLRARFGASHIPLGRVPAAASSTPAFGSSTSRSPRAATTRTCSHSGCGDDRRRRLGRPAPG